MPTYYVDPAAGGANDGSSWANAWTSMGSAVAGAAGADIIYCRGKEVLAAAITCSANGGTGDFISWIGCNAAGVDDGTPYELDGDGAAANCLITNGSYQYFKNFYCHGATAIGIVPSGAYNLFYNIKATLNGSHGFYSNISQYNTVIRCSSINNTSDGYCCPSAYTVLCNFSNNGARNVYDNGHNNTFVGCTINNAVGRGVFLDANDAMFMHCTFDGNGDDSIYAGSTRLGSVIGCRLTSCAADAIQTAAGAKMIDFYNFFLANGADRTAAAGSTILQLLGSLTAGTEGYVNKAGGDYTTADNATLRATPVTVGALF